MCASVTGLLMPATASWFRRRPTEAELCVRVGRGRATYCQQQRHRYTITFGVRMVADKCQPALAHHWMTTHELHRRGYCAANPTVAQLLAHTVCHEFAHLVQQVNGWCRRGSVHNAAFYEILDRLHVTGLAREIGPLLEAANDDGAVSLDATLPAPGKHAAETAAGAFRCGDRVCFEGRGGREIVGRIRRINRVTATVIPEDRRYRVSYYRVPFSLLVRL